MDNIFTRTEALIGKDSLDILRKSKVIVFGVGGVGSYVVEALARAGLGCIDVVDSDWVNITNINRQLIALQSTLGRKKVEVIKERMLDINPDIIVNTFDMYYDSKTMTAIDLAKYNYIVDAIDSVTSKILLIQEAKRFSVPIISSMGTGNKLNPAMFKIDDIKKTSVCPLARVMRNELKKRNINNVKVLFSEETPIIKQRTPASISFVPSSAGLLIAAEVVKDLIGEKNDL